MTSLLSPGLYTMELRSIDEPKVKGDTKSPRFLLAHRFGIPGDLSTHITWLYFSSQDTLSAYLCAAPILLGRSFAVDVLLKEEKVGNKVYSWNTIKPWWEQGTLPAKPHQDRDVLSLRLEGMRND